MSSYVGVRNCQNCECIDMTVVLTSHPPQAYCTRFNQPVFLNSDTCIDGSKLESDFVPKATTLIQDLIDLFTYGIDGAAVINTKADMEVLKILKQYL